MVPCFILIVTLASSATSFGTSFPAEFGQVDQSDNQNAEVSGTGNSGVVKGNHNTNLECSETVLNLISNWNLKVSSTTKSKLILTNTRNTELTSDECQVDARDCQNLHYSGKSSKVVVESSWNLKLEGSTNDFDISSSRNLNFKGDNSKIQSVKNENFDFTGHGGSVVAKDNNNLVVSGENNNLGIEDTKNHNVQPAVDSMNTLEILPSFRMCGSSSYITSTGMSMPIVKISYVSSATIKGGSYHLGIFEFSVKRLSGKTHEVTITDSSLDSGSLSVGTKRSSDIVLTGTKDGVTETLKLGSIQVSQTSDTVFVLDWSENC